MQYLYDENRQREKVTDMLINPIISINRNVNTNRTTDSEQTERNRGTKEQRSHTRHYRCIARQATLSRIIIRCLQSVHKELRDKDETGKPAKSTCKQEGRKEASTTNTSITPSLP